MKKPIKTVLSLLGLLLTAFLPISNFISNSIGAEVTLLWDANDEADLAGYILYQSTDTSGPPYDLIDDISLDELSDPDNPEAIVTQLESGKKYYFVVTAFDKSSNESDYSEKLVYSVPGPLPSEGGVLDSKFQEALVAKNAAYYTDRGYKLTDVPSMYIGMDMIKTPNDDKNLSAAGDYLTFQMPYDGTVYVAYDSRASSIPSWLSGFRDTGDVIYTSDMAQPYMKVYSKTYNAGTRVSLGTNKAQGFSGKSVSNYIVFYSENVSEVALDSKFEEALVAKNAAYYTDRGYKLTDVPSMYIGMDMIKTPNDDKNLSAAGDYLTFQMPYDGTVYVAYDSRASSIPNWLSGFRDTGDVIYNTDMAQPYMKVYSKTYNAGTRVSLGTNKAQGFSGKSVSNYIVFYCEGQ